MKKIIAITVTLSFILFVVCCKKGGLLPSNSNNGSTNPPINTDTTKPSAVGTATGPSVSQTIGAAGGTIVTADGRMELDIPAGALATNTNITIQNTTNTMASGIGDGYSMTPDGLKFAQPVTFKFHYADSDVNGSSPYLLDIAYQDSAGFWKGIPVTGLDSINNFVSVQTNHFTHYATYKILFLSPVAGDLIGNYALFVNKRETYVLMGCADNNLGNIEPLPSGQGGALQNGWLVNGAVGGSAAYGTAVTATTQNSGLAASEGIGNYVACTYTAPSMAPSGHDNPVKLSALLLVPISYLRYMLALGSPTRKVVTVSTSIKILDYNVYRLDIVDYHALGCGNVINFYDSSDIFFRIGPDEADSYDIPQDSIENFPPGASPITNTCGTCTYQWISEPIGSVNIVSGNVTYSGVQGSYFVILKVDEANENGLWYTETCSGVSGTETEKPTTPAHTLEFPMNIDSRNTNLDTLLVGTPNSSLIRLVLVRNGLH